MPAFITHNKATPKSRHPACGAKALLCVFLFTALILQPFAKVPLFNATKARAEFTLTDEMELGLQFYQLIIASIPTVQDPEVVEYATNLVTKLSAGMPVQPYRFKVTVIRDNSLNAFAIPGGFVFLHTGLITAMDHEAEVAGVLAHELAHVTQRHIAHRIDNAQKINILTLLGVLAGAFLGGGGDGASAAIVGSMAAGQAAMLNYSRSDESEADQVGFGYHLAAGYKPERMVDAFRKIQRPQWVTGSDIPPYLSTHPAVPERVADLTHRIQSMQNKPAQVTEDDAEFLRIQTLVRARYSNPDAAKIFFEEQAKGSQKDLAELGLGILYERQNKINEATMCFENAIKLRPKDQIFLREAGRFNYLRADKNKAINYLQLATAQNPHDYLALFYYARLLADSDQITQAISYYKLVLRYQPEDPEVHYYYAQTLGKAKENFYAYLHLAYSALYSNNPPRTEQAYNKVKNMAETQKQKDDLAFFEKKHAQRKRFWK